MDGVISNFDKAAKEGGWTHRPDLKVNFRNLELVPGAQDALIKLNRDFDIFIATTPPWSRPDVWGEKREWIGEHFPWLKRKMVLTHRKDLLIGDILIDDSMWRGQPDFQGTWFHFGDNGMDWKYVVEGIKSIMEVEKTWIKSEKPSKKSDFVPHNLRNK